MGKPVRSLKILARHEADLRKTCRALAKRLISATHALPSATPGMCVDRYLKIAAELEEAGAPLVIERPRKKNPS